MEQSQQSQLLELSKDEKKEMLMQAVKVLARQIYGIDIDLMLNDENSEASKQLKAKREQLVIGKKKVEAELGKEG